MSAAQALAPAAPDHARPLSIELDEIRWIGSDSHMAHGELRSLDAIHLATALSLEDRCGAVLVYDDRLARAAERHGLAVLAPA